MRLLARLLSLAQVGRRRGRGLLARFPSLAQACRRLGQGPLARLLPLAQVGRTLGRGPLAVLVALAGAALALGISAGSSDRPAKRPSAPAPSAEAAGGRLLAPPTATLTRAAERHRRRARRGGARHYRRTARKRVRPADAKEFLPLYREAERVYSVNWRLIASIHRQETAFSTSPSTYHGLNDFGCCAGPMQFNVTNGPVSTWKRYRQAFRDGRRPKRYPHRTRSHPSIYDDFDAIMAAGSLLRDSGAGRPLDVGTWGAAYDYYGHDLFGITYASQVLARAEAWQRDGFCPNCPLDEVLVAEFDELYGEPIRRELTADERRRKMQKEARERAADRRKREADLRDRIARRKRADRRSKDRARRRAKRPSAKRSRPAKPSPPRRRRRTAPTAPAPPPPTTTQPSTPPTAPRPPADDCNVVRKLLGCKPQ